MKVSFTDGYDIPEPNLNEFFSGNFVVVCIVLEEFDSVISRIENHVTIEADLTWDECLDVVLGLVGR
jgi:hypothetical protein